MKFSRAQQNPPQSPFSKGGGLRAGPPFFKGGQGGFGAFRHKGGSRIDLPALLAQALPRATPHALARLILSSDPQLPRIAPSEQDRLVDAALADGEALAVTASARWSTDPDLIARHLSVPVTESDEESGYGSTILYAEYTTRPPRIVLYRTPLARLDRRLVQASVCELLGLAQARSVYLAHELYHHLDLQRGERALARRERVTLLRLGGFRWTSGIASLAEIAAGVFAQRLLGLRFHPKLLDLIPIYESNPEAAWTMVRKLR